MESAERELARRKIYQAMIEQGMTPDQQQVVSGRVVPYSPIQGISKLAQAYLGRRGLDKMEAQKLEEGNQSAQAYQDALTTIQGIPGQAEGSQDSGLNQLIGDSRVPSSKREAIAQAMLEKQLGLGKNQSNPYFTSTPMTKGGVSGQNKFNARTGEYEFFADNAIPYSQDPVTQAAIKAAEEKAKLEQQGLLLPDIERDKAREGEVGKGQGIEITQDQVAEAARRKAEAEASAKIKAEAGTKLAISADKFDAYYNEALNLLSKNPTESGLGAAFDAAGSFVGYTPKGAAAQDSLKVIAGNLTGLVPRFEGPQSDKDTALYKEMAAEVGANKPVERRLSALKTMKKLMDENIKNNTFKGFKDTAGSTATSATDKKEVSRKVKNGITIIKYSDGTYGQE